MRKIKFRGKRVDDDQWVHGYLAERSGVYILTTEEDRVTWHQVEHATVGEFTGLYDKTGQEIYEGDIVSTGLSEEFAREEVEHGYYHYTRACGDHGAYNCVTKFFGMHVDFEYLYDRMRAGEAYIVGNAHDKEGS